MKGLVICGVFRQIFSTLRARDVQDTWEPLHCDSAVSSRNCVAGSVAFQVRYGMQEPNVHRVITNTVKYNCCVMAILPCLWQKDKMPWSLYHNQAEDNQRDYMCIATPIDKHLHLQPSYYPNVRHRLRKTSKANAV
jgi:hypothetical protein